MAKKNLITTPKGKAEYAWLTKPDTKFDKPHGVYKINVVMSKEAAAPMIAVAKETATKLLAEKKGAEKNPVKAKKIKLSSDRPFTDNEDGTVTLKFKMKARVEREGKESFDQKPALFDSMGQPLVGDKAPLLGNGSVVKVSFEPVGYHHPKEGIGCTFRLKAVQIIKLVPYTAGDASAYGFSEEEDEDGEGFSAENASAATGASDDDDDTETQGGTSSDDDDTDGEGAGASEGGDDDADY